MSNETNTQGLMQSRGKVIIKTSVIGIIANLALAGFKALVGLMANSIAVVLDAVNNLSDALSSVITIIATRLASRAPDKKHPLGHGRIEYLSTLIIAAIVLYAGITALVESVKKIIHPETPDYSWLTLAVIAAAVVVKVLLGRYFKRVGGQVNSGSLQASGQDALSDAMLSIATLVCAGVFMLFGLSLEAYVGVVIAVFIIRAGYEMLNDALNEILGKRMDPDFAAEIRKTICADRDVLGAYDLILHNYGPERTVGSVHVEIPDTMTAEQIDQMERRIAHAVFAGHGVIMTAVGIYSVNTSDNEVGALRSDVIRRAAAHDGVLQIHGFSFNRETKTVTMDIILDYDLPNRKEIFEQIRAELQAAYPDLRFELLMDIDY